ncbi:MAG: lactate racemase domain-containing protein [Kiritimatiellia bacterium]
MGNRTISTRYAFDKPILMIPVGRSSFGYEVRYNREYAQADRRIIMGFIEPHFMAGYSGGYKAVFPGVTGVEAILHYHNAAHLEPVHDLRASVDAELQRLGDPDAPVAVIPEGPLTIPYLQENC